MNRQAPENGSEEVTQLGESSVVCHTSPKTLVWSFVLALLPIGFGIAVLIFLVKMLLADWSRDIFGSLILIAVGVLSLWAGRVLWRKANRLRHVKVAVHTGGLSYRDDSTCLTCRWDQIEEVRWRVSNHYEKHSLAVGGVVPIPGASAQIFSHTTNHVTVRRKDGVQMVFTDELQNIVELARAINEGASRNIGSA